MLLPFCCWLTDITHLVAELFKTEAEARLEEFGLVSVASSPAEFARFLREDFALQARIVKQAGIQPQ